MTTFEKLGALDPMLVGANRQSIFYVHTGKELFELTHVTPPGALVLTQLMAYRDQALMLYRPVTHGSLKAGSTEQLRVFMGGKLNSSRKVEIRLIARAPVAMKPIDVCRALGVGSGNT